MSDPVQPFKVGDRVIRSSGLAFAGSVAAIRLDKNPYRPRWMVTVRWDAGGKSVEAAITLRLESEGE